VRRIYSFSCPTIYGPGCVAATFPGSFGLGLSTTTTSERRDLSPGANTYLFRVRAVDKAGNTGACKLGPGFKVTAFQESSTAIVHTGLWNTATLSGAYGGSVQHASVAGRKATFSVPAATKNVGVGLDQSL
jgi:hypothetical protein